jgi:hypothetical protein
MSAKELLLQTSVVVSAVAGPTLAAAEATGVLHETSRPFMVYVLSGGLTLIGGMFTALMWFIKREHSSITTGLTELSKGMQSHSVSIAAMSISVERGFAEMRGEMARRMLIEEHGKSTSRLHDKVNKIGRTVSYMRGKLGFDGDDTEDDDDNGGKGNGGFEG